MKWLTNDKNEVVKNLLACIIIISCFFSLFYLVLGNDYIYGSHSDWRQQHILFPEYFRTLFYDTFDLFPDFAFNLGGGQNIYNFSYYSFLNPLVILSYLFPFIEMIDWYQIIGCIIPISSAILMYFYLKRRHSFLTSLNGKTVLTAKENGVIRIKLDKKLENEILFIRIKLGNYPSCEDNNMRITINGIGNKLTCKTWKYHVDNTIFDYAIYDTDSLKIKLTDGIYEIENVEYYLMDESYISDINNNIDEFVFDEEQTKGDKIVGNIDVTEDGYFTLSVPYDKGFKVYVDGEKIEYEKVNTAFIGFPINEGEHHIEIEYEAQFKKIGMILSLFGMVSYFLIVYKQNRGKI